ncbi:MAG: class I SAM-dependent methyltransferase [archaeon]|nr:class I SAM-dependent methyltransferase [archaeon]
MKIYNKPLYYEIAFSFVDAKKQTELFEKFIKKYSKLRVKRVLDIACGPSLQLRELAKKGYEAVGLDLSSQMLEFLQQKAVVEGIKIETIKANMMKFKLKKKADFAFIMMGSFKFKNNNELLKHLNCVSNSLKKGALYLIENLEFGWKKRAPQYWTMKRNGIKVKTTYSLRMLNARSQSCEEKILMKAIDNKKKLKFFEKRKIKYFFLQEFEEIIKLDNKFEFIGLFDRNKIKKLEKPNPNNLVVLRKK